jgi:CubicO group peptidase (beta-lactamase class C family)
MPGLSDAFEAIGEAIEHTLPSGHAPGMALAVTDDRETLGAAVRGFAEVARGVPVKPDTRFQIGSISKSFVALVALQEEAEGNLSLDASINDLLPWLELPEPFGPITLHHLLTHTGGLMIGAEHGPWGMADALRLREQPPTFAPGERFWYSNAGYKLVGHALERITGRPIHDLLTERVLGPLAMASSEGAITEAARMTSAVGYEPVFSDRPAHLETPLAPAVWQSSNAADGSIISTVADMCEYARLVLNGGRGPHGGLLSPEAFERWVGPHVDSDEPNHGYGYGWGTSQIAGRRTVWHTGGTIGFTALVAVWPEEGLGVAAMANGSVEKRATGWFALEAVAAALKGEPLPTFEHPPAPDLVADAEALAGRYSSGARTWELEAESGGLVLRTGPLAVRLHQVSPGSLIAPHPALDRYPIRPVKEEGEQVIGVTYGPGWFGREGAEPVLAADLPAGWEAFPGLYRSDNPWSSALSVYARLGRLYLTWPADPEEELELTPGSDGWLIAGEAWSPRRARFSDVVDGLAQTLEFNGQVLTRSFEGLSPRA